MARFKDNAGREWDITITTATIKRVRASALAVDLLEIVEGKLLTRLYRDPVFLVDLVYEICRPQCEEKDVSAEQFGEAMAGDAIAGAVDALTKGLTDFFPLAEDRENLGLVKAKVDAVMKAGTAIARERLESLDVNVLAAQVLQRAGELSGNVPESSASTPAPSPSPS